MPKKATRPLPSLIALPIPQLPKRPHGTGPRHPSGRPGQPDSQETRKVDIRGQAIMESMDALRAVIAVTESFIADGPAYVQTVTEWLKLLKAAFDELEEGLDKGWLDGVVTIETKGVDSLDAALDATPDLDDADNEAIDIVARRCLTFWIEEIERRGRELFDICIVSVDVVAAQENFAAMRTLRYPVK